VEGFVERKHIRESPAGWPFCSATAATPRCGREAQRTRVVFEQRTGVGAQKQRGARIEQLVGLAQRGFRTLVEIAGSDEGACELEQGRRTLLTLAFAALFGANPRCQLPPINAAKK